MSDVRAEGAPLNGERCIVILDAGTRICGNLDHPSVGLIIMAFCFGAFCSERIPLMVPLFPFATEGRRYLRARVCRRERPCGPCSTGVCVHVCASKLYTQTPYIRTSAPIGPYERTKAEGGARWKEERRRQPAGGTGESTRGRRSQPVGQTLAT